MLHSNPVRHFQRRAKRIPLALKVPQNPRKGNLHRPEELAGTGVGRVIMMNSYACWESLLMSHRNQSQRKVLVIVQSHPCFHGNHPGAAPEGKEGGVTRQHRSPLLIHQITQPHRGDRLIGLVRQLDKEDLWRRKT